MKQSEEKINNQNARNDQMTGAKQQINQNVRSDERTSEMTTAKEEE